MFSFQSNLNTLSLGREDFKLSFVWLNNKFPNMVQGSLNILQSVSSWQRQRWEKEQGIERNFSANYNQL